jgi:hypothetical protein
MSSNQSQKGMKFWIVFLLLVVILLAPIVLYIAKFGLVISNDHQRWGEMGSAMSGIYSPILAWLALIVLSKQLLSQNSINEHQFDQSYISEARADIQYYLEQLQRKMDTRMIDGSNLRDHIDSLFSSLKTEKESAKSQKIKAKNIHQTDPTLFSLWSAIYPILIGLKTIKRYPYEHNFSNALQKIIAMNTYESCVALDNYHYLITDGRSIVEYQFTTEVKLA